jgi:LPS sulfotransferase NodH
MTLATESGPAAEGSAQDRTRLEVAIYQIVDDGLLKENRADGSGWDWCWADWQRSWMDASQSRFAYRCLPLTIANQTGLWVKNPVGFTATWRGHDQPGSIDFHFDVAAELWKNWVSSIFGLGIITWNTPFLFRTKPDGSRLLVCGPANYFKDNAHPLTAIIESDWMNMSFTMNWKVMRSDQPIRFEAGDPLFQVIPVLGNACSDLEHSSVVYRKLDDDPEIARAYREWDQSRSRFTARSKAGELKPDDWQRDYFLGRDAAGRHVAPAHMTKVKPPRIAYDGSARPPRRAESPTPLGESALAAQFATATVTAAAAPIALEVNDEWRSWIAENLIHGAAGEAILAKMVAEGFGPSDSAAEIALALRSPYVNGARRLVDRLEPREPESTHRPVPRPIRLSYFISTAPRTGSGLLAEALESTRIAGIPREYFDPNFESQWYDDLFIRVESEYFDKILSAGTTANGVFAAKVHWYQFAHMTAKLRQHSVPGATGLDRLAHTFPDLRYIFLTRKDKIRQAVSYVRAIRTGVWWSFRSKGQETSEPPPSISQHELKQIDFWVSELANFESRWRAHFDHAGVTPFEVAYEDFVRNYAGTVVQILDYLGLSTAGLVTIAPPRLRKQADAISEEWVRRYLDHKSSAP